MYAEELITTLQNLVEKHGNQDVIFGSASIDDPVTVVEYNDDDGEFFILD